MLKISARLLISYILYCFTFLFISDVYAASLSISDTNISTISDPNQEYQVKVDLSINATDGTVYYLRGVFYKQGTNNYCGYTWNGSSWFNGPYSTNEGWKNFLQVTISPSSASTILKAKLDTNDSGCQNSGNYNFKVQRFTQGGSATFDSQSEQSLIVNIPTPTPTVTPIPTAVPTSVPTHTSASTATPKPQNTPTVYFSPSATQKPTSTVSVYDSNGYIPLISDTGTASGEVLGKEFPSNTTTDSSLISSTKKEGSFPLLLMLLGSGVGCIIGAVILSLRKIKK